MSKMSEVKRRPRVSIAFNRRSLSASPPIVRSAGHTRKPENTFARRCSSLSPRAKPIGNFAQDCMESNAADIYSSVPSPQPSPSESGKESSDSEKDMTLPQSLVIKLARSMITKKREFMRMRKSLIQQQNNFLELYAMLRETETRTGKLPDHCLGDIRIVSVTDWPAHDLLLLIRDDINKSLDSDIKGVFGPQVIQQLHDQLGPIPGEVVTLCREFMARRIELLNIFRSKNRSSMDWKSKNAEIDQDTEKLHELVEGAAENMKAKINYSMELAKIPWLDRDNFVTKMERLQKENILLQHKIEEASKKEYIEHKVVAPSSNQELRMVSDELTKERAAREALKDVVSTAESMLRVARARITTLERQLKESKAETETARRKLKDLEQLVKQTFFLEIDLQYRHRETSFDARSKKLIEVSKTGEQAKEALSRQRDALELRVKELREQAEAAERNLEMRESEQKARAESLQAKVSEQEKRKEAAENRISELEGRIKEMEDLLRNLRERSARLVDMERKRCLDYVPSKENEPSDRETEIWKELQMTRLALSRAEEELRQSHAEKDSFLNSLSKIAQDGEESDSSSFQSKISTELLDREQKIAKLRHVIEEQKENEKLMEQTMTQYENKLATLRLEVMRLRNYDCYIKEVPYQDLQKELLDLHMQVGTLTRERASLVTAAASRALMLERHERAAELFARVTRARRDLSALLDGRHEPPPMREPFSEVSRSLTCVFSSSEDTWTALRAERARVLRLETAVLAQSLQLEREGRVRTQLERRRALLERQLLRVHASPSERNRPIMAKNSSMIRDFFSYR